MKKFNLIVFLLSVFFTYSCQKQDITSNTGAFPLYVEGYLESGQFAVVHISKTMDISTLWDDVNLEDSLTIVYKQNNLHALLLKDNVIVDSLTGPYKSTVIDGPIKHWDNWLYLHGTSHIIEQGGHYKVVIKRTLHPDIVAECVIPYKVEIQNIDTVVDHNSWLMFGDFTNPYLPIVDSTKLHYIHPFTMNLNFTDPAGQVNYYLINVYGLRTRISTPDYPYYYMQFHLKDNSLFEGHSILNMQGSSIPTEAFFNDKLISGQQQHIDVSDAYSNYDADSLIRVNLFSISEGYYKNLKSTYLFKKDLADQFSTPVQIYGNFTNAYGFLAGQSVTTVDIKIKQYKSMKD